MKEARFVYKCRYCGAKFQSMTCCNVDIALAKVLVASDVPKTSTHNCRANRVGLCDLAGYNIVETE